MPIEFNIIAALILGMVILQVVVAQFPYLRYTRTALYLTVQILTAALAASGIVYISIFIL
jgi:predicted aconitase